MAKGRDKSLISLRDEKLIRRYYYWTEIQRRRFDDTLTILSQEEFFISEARIMQIIRKYADQISDLHPVKKVRLHKIKASEYELFVGDHPHPSSSSIIHS